MICNGILIQTDRPGEMIEGPTEYRGVAYGDPWPISPHNSVDIPTAELMVVAETERATSQLPLDGQWYTPAVLSDLQLAADYLGLCIQRQVLVRVVLCFTPRKIPILEQHQAAVLLASSKFLGYDYAYSSCTFSALYSDLNPPPSPIMEKHRARLNDYGLLNSASELAEYIAERWEYIHALTDLKGCFINHGTTDTELEDFGDFVEFELYEIGNAALLELNQHLANGTIDRS